MNIGKDERFLVKRCLSDGDFLHESCTPLSAMSSNHESMPQKGFSAPLQHVSHILSESSSDIPVSNDVALSRFVSIALTSYAEWS
jgi:hypothetical protein